MHRFQVYTEYSRVWVLEQVNVPSVWYCYLLFQLACDAYLPSLFHRMEKCVFTLCLVHRPNSLVRQFVFWAVLWLWWLHDNDKAGVGDSFQMFSGSPKRTILLDDIEDLEDEEDLQDQLEIHFQKPSNCGGEIQHIKYTSRGSVQVFFLCEDVEKMEWAAGAKHPAVTMMEEPPRHKNTLQTYLEQVLDYLVFHVSGCFYDLGRRILVSSVGTRPP